MKSDHVLLITHHLSESNLRRIKGDAPNLQVLSAEDQHEIRRLLPSAEIVFGEITSASFSSAKKLRWVHIPFAGVEKILFPEFVKSPVILTSSRGLHKHQMSELLFGMMLTLARRLGIFRNLQSKKEWNPAPFRETELLAGKTIGILGLGSVGSEVARVAAGFGMRVIGMRRTPEIRVPDVNEVFGPRDLPRLLSQADYIVVLLPLTAETRNLITKKEFELMERQPYFFNLARGAIVNEGDLVEALRKGRVKGAGLDVFVDEPLASSSPLWEMENVIITPHVGGLVPQYMRHAVDLFLENLRRYLEGRELHNIVDKERGY
jgi:D-2-hydroxyacid dehydrogenase (NADP+)